MIFKSKNEVFSQLLNLGLDRIDINRLSILFENTCILGSEEKIYPHHTDESIYILPDNTALHKNNKYIIEKDLSKLDIDILDTNEYILDRILIRKNGFSNSVPLSICFLNDIGLLIPFSN